MAFGLGGCGAVKYFEKSPHAQEQKELFCTMKKILIVIYNIHIYFQRASKI